MILAAGSFPWWEWFLIALAAFVVAGGIVYVRRQNRSQVFVGVGPSAPLDDNLEDNIDQFSFQYADTLKQGLGGNPTKYEDNFGALRDAFFALAARISSHKDFLAKHNREKLPRVNVLIEQVEKVQKIIDELVKIKLAFDKLAAKKGKRDIKKVQSLREELNKQLGTLQREAGTQADITQGTWFYQYALYLQKCINGLLPVENRPLVLSSEGLVDNQKRDEHYQGLLSPVEGLASRHTKEDFRVFQDTLLAKITALRIFHEGLEQSSGIKQAVSALYEYVNSLKESRERIIVSFNEIQEEYASQRTFSRGKMECFERCLRGIENLINNSVIVSQYPNTWIVQYYKDTQVLYDFYKNSLTKIENQSKFNQIKEEILVPDHEGRLSINNRLEYYYRELFRIETELTQVEPFFGKEEGFSDFLQEAKFFAQLMIDLMILDYNLRKLEGNLSEGERNSKHSFSRDLNTLSKSTKRIEKNLREIQRIENLKTEEVPIFKLCKTLINRLEAIQRKEEEIASSASDRTRNFIISTPASAVAAALGLSRYNSTGGGIPNEHTALLARENKDMREAGSSSVFLFPDFTQNLASFGMFNPDTDDAARAPSPPVSLASLEGERLQI